MVQCHFLTKTVQKSHDGWNESEQNHYRYACPALAEEHLPLFAPCPALCFLLCGGGGTVKAKVIGKHGRLSKALREGGAVAEGQRSAVQRQSHSLKGQKGRRREKEEEEAETQFNSTSKRSWPSLVCPRARAAADEGRGREGSEAQ